MYQLIYLPLIAAIVAQIIKLIIDGSKAKFTWIDLNSYGGMPSSHSALVTALAASIGFYTGWDSPGFAVALAFAIIVIRDAGGFRIMLGKHAKELNQIIHNVAPQEGANYPHLTERIGHTPLEIIVGMLVGIATVIVYILI